MDSDWLDETHQPTAAEQNVLRSAFVRPSIQYVKFLKKELQALTESLKNSPYDPDLWLKRSNANLLLLWPELALGDAHKTELLLSSGSLPEVSKHPQHHLVTLLHQLFETYHQCFCLLDDRENQLANNKKALERFPDNAVFRRRHDRLQVLREAPEAESSGAILRRRYPWMRPETLRRDPGVVAAAQEIIQKASMGRCILGSVSDSSQVVTTSASTSDAYGIYATSNIDARETIFVDTSLFVSVSDMNERCAGCCDILEETTTNLPCCDAAFCSDKCAQNSLHLFHPTVCGKDYPRLQGITDRNLSLDYDDLSRQHLLVRVLATVVQHPCPDPLAVPLINQLSAPYSGDHLTSFDFDESIVVPTAILQDLGVDVFANQFYDTWVIQTILARIYNNRNGESDENGSWHAIYPLFTFFNHSCRPNVAWNNCMDERSNMLRVTAEKDIKAGEQLTVSYDEDCETMVWRQRHKYLEHWMPSGCDCWLCGEEKAMEGKAKEGEDEEIEDGKTFEMSSDAITVEEGFGESRIAGH